MSRPDPSSPTSIADAGFSTARRGYQTDEVRAFLVAVAAEMERLKERETQLLAQLREARDQAPVGELDDETVTKLLGEETLRVLQTARESASQIKARAEESAARLLREASDESNRLRQEAEVDVARKRQDAVSDAEAEVALAKQQGREMVNEARAYRERVLADLDRRTTLARHQIEELIHGRDRLLQVFERARLVAVDVTSELRAVDSPDELVNLTPTTGPVPIMVPNSPRPTPEPASPDADADHDDDDDDDDETVDELGDETVRDDPAGADEPADTIDDDTIGDATIDDDVGTETVDADTIDDETETETVDADTIDDETETEIGDEIDDAVDDAVGGVETDDEPVRDANVVSLFRGRETPTETAVKDEHPSVDTRAHEQTDETEPADEHGQRDVGDLFDRLRQEVPAAAADDTAASETVETTDVDSADRVDADGVDADGVDADGVDEPAVAETAFSRRDAALVPLIVAGARRIKRVLADEQNEALDHLRQRESVASIDALLPAVDQHTANYLDALADELADAAVAGAVEIGERATAKLRKRLIADGALANAHDLVRSALVEPLRERLERAIGDGAGDNEAITKRVRAVYREWKTQHIDDQLDDVFLGAYGGGIAVAVDAGRPLIWSVDPSEPPCPDCEDNSLAGSVAAGDAFPTGHTSAPAHPGCRCLTLPTDR